VATAIENRHAIHVEKLNGCDAGELIAVNADSLHETLRSSYERTGREQNEGF
jgi:hypothetical protein